MLYKRFVDDGNTYIYIYVYLKEHIVLIYLIYNHSIYRI